MKNILLVMIFAAVLPVAMAQVDEIVAVPAEKVEVAQYCNVPPRSAPAKAVATKAAPVSTVISPAMAKLTPLSSVAWPDELVYGLFIAVGLLALAVMFLLGRATAPAAQPQVVTPVVYVQPPPQGQMRQAPHNA